MNQLPFLNSFPEVQEPALQAESLAIPDPRTACFHARRALELALHWAYKHDNRLKLPYNDNLSALIHEPSFQDVVGRPVFTKCRILARLGNEAVHGSATIREEDGIAAVRELWQILYWFACTYSKDPPGPMQFDKSLLPREAVGSRSTAAELAALQAQRAEQDEKLTKILVVHGELNDELKRLRAQIEETRKANEAVPVDHDFNEAETRDFFIDLLLKEAGWKLNGPNDLEYEVQGMPNPSRKGYVDYVLWGDDGSPLGIVEAKSTKNDPRIGQQQAKLYADCLEAETGQRPVIFYSNGYKHWIWEDDRYPPREIQGFYSKAELQLLIQRRTTRHSLAETQIKKSIVDRHYQNRAIRRICESFESDQRRKALLVMATGTGKTRTAIALADVMMRANWAKRILFLADRRELANQAGEGFKTHLPSFNPVNLLEEKDTEGRIYVSTYHTMMNLIDEVKEGQRRFSVGHFDLVIIDEAHRSIFRKYKAIFEYFDAPLLGLTATPKDEIERNTYSTFDLEAGVPTDAYNLDEAIKDRYLVPPEAHSVPLLFPREGIHYDELPDEDKEQWDNLDWGEEDEPPRDVDADHVNKWLFNDDTVDKALAHVMTNGQKIEGGDRLAKTIIFAKNQAHADFIDKRFNVHYPHLAGKFARVITYQTKYADTLIKDFKRLPDPGMAISVDMLDTGIDVPEVCNLVFFKVVRSKTKFWQMIGRGTRLCENLFGPGQDKKSFFIFDFCRNLEHFSLDLPEGSASVAPSLKERLFQTRLGLVQEFDQRDGGPPGDKPDAADPLRREFAETLRHEVASMNLENFVVRPQRKLVERFSKEEAWGFLEPEQAPELAKKVAPLPAEMPPEQEEAKRFDLMMLTLELALLRDDPNAPGLRDKVRSLAERLEEKRNIPVVQKELNLIQDLQTDAWWEDVTTAMLEHARRQLRTLIHLLDKHVRTPLYTDFEDEIGMAVPLTLPGTTTNGDFQRFREKAKYHLRSLDEDPVVQCVRRGEPLNSEGLAHLESLLEGIAGSDNSMLKQVREAANGTAGFVRSLVGLDRDVAKRAFGKFLNERNMNSHQIQFLNMVVDYIVEHGSIQIKALYEPPFTDLAPKGWDALFDERQITDLETCILQASA